MLQRSTNNAPIEYRAVYPAGAEPVARNASVDGEVLSAVTRSLRRHLRMIVATTLVGTIIAVVAVLMITPQYRAGTTILIDARQTKLLGDADLISRPVVDNGVVESEAELMKSPALARRVVEKLNLIEDDEFNGSGGPIAQLKRLVLLPVRLLLGRSGSADPIDAVAENLRANVDARRRGLTYVIELTAWSRDRAKAALIADTFAEIYLQQQLEAQNELAQRATKWLNERSDELRARVMAADRAVEEYRAQAGLFAPGGENLSDRQIAQLNEELVRSRAKAAEAKAKFEQLKQITPEKLRSAAASPDVLQSSVVSNLRTQYAEVARRQAELTTRYGARHPQVLNSQAELNNIAGQITAEIERIVNSARNEYEVAKSREESLQASLDDLKTRAGEINQAGIRLRELEREAEASKSVFEAFLARSKEAASQLNMQVSDTRVVSPATVPTAPSHPQRTLIVGLAFFGSLGLGIAIALGRETMGRGFRRSDEVESVLGLPPLTSIPLVEVRSPPALTGPKPLIGDLRTLHLGGQTKAGEKRAADARTAADRQLAAIVLDRPDSAFTESVHALRYSLRHQNPARDSSVIVISSALPGEGKSTVAANLARAAASVGEKVLLIDADLRRPSLGAMLEVEPTSGLVGLVSGTDDISRVVQRDPRSGLFVLAGADRASSAQAMALLSSRRMSQLIHHARSGFDLVVIDSPPLLPVADTRALIDHADGVLLVVASEQTSRDAVAAALRETPGLDGKLTGVVLNKAEPEFERYYRDYRSAEPAVAS